MNDPLSPWRLQDHMLVPDAAILMVGGDPGEYVERESDDFGNETYREQKRDYPGYEAALSALKSAILHGSIAAKFVYSAAPDPHHFLGPDKASFKLTSSRNVWEILNKKQAPSNVPDFNVEVSKEPLWDDVYLEVETLRKWLRAKNAHDGFFVEKAENGDKATVVDSSHEHFSPELALAVTVWGAMAPRRTFRNTTPKKEIRDWLDKNPDAWQGKAALSNDAKERISIVVNWRKGGPAKTPE